MENSQSKKLPLFSLYLVWMCCLLLAAKAWRPLSLEAKARHHLLLPQLPLTGGPQCPSRVVGWQERGDRGEGELP